MSDDVLTEVADGIAVITINRPQARNAVNGAVARGIAGAIEEFDDRSDVRVLVLTGAGGLVRLPRRIPYHLAMEIALAGGFELALACDLIVASEEAKFGLPEVRRGLAAGAGGLVRLPRRIPYHLAMEIALTGEHFPAARLQAAGLVNIVVPAGEALEGARELARRVALGAPLSLVASKQVVAAAADWDSSEAFARQGEIIGPVFTSADAIEGATAFAEKRAPAWRGV